MRLQSGLLFCPRSYEVLTIHYWALPNNKSRRVLNNTIVVPGWSSSGYLCLSFEELEGSQKNMLLCVCSPFESVHQRKQKLKKQQWDQP